MVISHALFVLTCCHARCNPRVVCWYVRRFMHVSQNVVNSRGPKTLYKISFGGDFATRVFFVS